MWIYVLCIYIYFKIILLVVKVFPPNSLSDLIIALFFLPGFLAEEELVPEGEELVLPLSHGILVLELLIFTQFNKFAKVF